MICCQVVTNKVVVHMPVDEIVYGYDRDDDVIMGMTDIL